MTKKRKLSDLTSQEKSTLVKLLTNIEEDLDHEDPEEGEFIGDLHRVLQKLQQAGGFSGANVLSLASANITVGPLFLIVDKMDEIRTLGQKSATGGLTIEETKKTIGLIRDHVSFETEAGHRLLINAILLHVASNLGIPEMAVIIAPELRIPQTALASTGWAYGGSVDYMMALCPERFKNFVLQSPKIAFSNPDIAQKLTSNIYEAKSVDLHTAVPQAAVAAVVECQRHGFQTLRGCVSNGEAWSFFVYNNNPNGNNGNVSVLPNITLKDDLGGLTFIIGFLYDWIKNGKKKAMEFCTYI